MASGEACDSRAILVLTGVFQGTSTTVAKRRIELRCGLSGGHPGEHVDAARNERWSDRPGERPTIVRMEREDDAAASD
ncbi:MAG TPA: hypothetical protein VHV30_05860 [Polyangiaceae bacterium]|jgi:hypothetical protein|nr:hypothetical protein [Polyangiaceae bacterium]